MGSKVSSRNGFNMQIPHLINLIHGEMTAWRQDLRAHPELGFEEHRTSEFVAGKLAEFGCEIRRNIGKTGVVGVLRRACQAPNLSVLGLSAWHSLSLRQGWARTHPTD